MYTDLQKKVLGKLVLHMPDQEARPLVFTIYKNQLKMDHRLKYKTLNYETTRRK